LPQAKLRVGTGIDLDKIVLWFAQDHQVRRNLLETEDSLPHTHTCSPRPPARLDRFRYSGRPWVVVAEIIVLEVGGLVVELAWEAEIIRERARRIIVAERVVVPLPHGFAAGVSDLMR
jgi:hypothetical protein